MSSPCCSFLGFRRLSLVCAVILGACGSTTGGTGTPEDAGLSGTDATVTSDADGSNAGQDVAKSDGAGGADAAPGEDVAPGTDAASATDTLTDTLTDTQSDALTDAAADAGADAVADAGGASDAGGVDAAAEDVDPNVTATCIVIHATGNGQPASFFAGFIQPAAGGVPTNILLDTNGESCVDTGVDTEYYLSAKSLPTPTGYLQYKVKSGHVQGTCGGSPKACQVVNLEFNTTGAKCVSPAECSDGNACTDDNCGIFGICIHSNSPQKCTGANACEVGMCEGGACKLGTPCDDGNPCTTDVCNPGNTCSHTPADGSACTPLNVCHVGQCDASGSCQDTGADLICDDQNKCTTDSCQQGKGGCVYDPYAFTGTSCFVGETSGICSTIGQCDIPQCDDGKKNEQETDVDCGGWCGPCGDQKKCNIPTECQSQICDKGLCAKPTCTDQIQNGDEVHVDCGGSCPGCADFASCTSGDQCASGWCSDYQTCQTPTCNDNAHNGSETDVDCGGVCKPCETAGQKCSVVGDCASQKCVKGACVDPTCDDGLMNGHETGKDCGGFDWGTGCPGCGTGGACNGDFDCKDKVCATPGVCVSAACNDGVQNGSESGIDCGGGLLGSGCALCQSNQGCLLDSDCASHVCGPLFACNDPSCADGVTNADETGADCGGWCGATCPDDTACTYDTDCSSYLCLNGKCTPKLKLGVTCQYGDDCDSGACADGVCCENKCIGECVSCNAADTGGASGTCLPVTVGLPDTMCVSPQVCNDYGKCSLPIGSQCTTDSECTYGNCYDGVCCDTICLGTCTACNVPNSVGYCGPAAAGTDPHDDCAGAAACVGWGPYCQQ